VNVNVPPGGGPVPEPVNPNLQEFLMSEAGNKLAHGFLFTYVEWCEAKGVKPILGQDWEPPADSPEKPLPKKGDDEKLERRKGLKLIEGQKEDDDDEED
jgi:hypothetical protein